MEQLPVIFKKEGRDVVAFFPTLPGNSAFDLQCYAHIGQHSAASLGYLMKCRPAKPEEYAELLTELRGIYERGDNAVQLQIVRRRTHAHDKARIAAFNGLEG